MNNPSREEFEAFKAEVREEVRQLREQVTEPIHLTIDRNQDPLIQTLINDVGRSNTDIGTLKHEMAGARADIVAIKDSQADQRDRLKDHTERLGRIEATMATKDDIAIMATKDDIAELKGLIKQLLPKPPEGQ